MKKLMIALLATLPIWANANAASCCDGLLTASATSAMMDLTIEDTADNEIKTEAQLRLEAGLVGKWQNTTYPFDLVAVDGNPNEKMEGAKLSFEFRADGTYTKTLGSKTYQLEEKGQWEVTRDGRQLLLYPSGSLTPDVATVKYQEYDEMVVEHALKCTYLPYCTGVKDFFFSKF